VTLNLIRALREKNAEKNAQLDATEAELAHFQAKADAREPRVNTIWSWAKDRRISNGIGQDFEWDLSNPRRFGSTS
jgi:hypothetical protein